MRCEKCMGSKPGFIYIKRTIDIKPQGYPDIHHWVPCPECGGSGVAHCCDGLCEQPNGEKR